MSPSRPVPFEVAGLAPVTLTSVDRYRQDQVAWRFSDEVLDPASCGDLQVNGIGPAEVVEWTGNLLIVRYDVITDPATWAAVFENNEPWFGDGRQLAPAGGDLERYV